MRYLLPVALCALFGGSTVAQQEPLYPPQIRGMMPSFQSGLVFSNTMSTINRKPEGRRVSLDTFTGTGGPTNGGPGNAEYTMAEIISGLALSTSMVVEDLEIDAMSTGNDAVPLAYFTSTSDFHISQGNAYGWATVYLTLDSPDPRFGPNDVMGYYFQNPSFPVQLQSGIYYEIRGSDFFSPPPGNIAALDVAMGLLDSNDGRKELGIINEVERLYFSLTPTSAANLDMAINGRLHRDVPGQPIYTGTFDGATIFVAEFDPTVGICTGVLVHADASDLMITSPAPDIDALAIGTVASGQPPLVGIGLQGGTLQYLYSTTQSNPMEELIVVAQVGPGPNPIKRRGRLRIQSGGLLVGGVGSTLQGNVKSVCSQDPDGPRGAASFGVPFAYQAANGDGTGIPMNLSLTARKLPTTSQDSFQLTGVVSGWGSGQPAASLCFLMVQLGGIVAPPRLVCVRSATDDVCEFSTTCNSPWVNLIGVPENAYTMWIVQARIPTYELTQSFPERITRKP